MNNKAILAVMMAAICLSAPLIVAGSEDVSAEATEYNEMREALTAAGYEVDGYTDEELIEEFGWFANKDLMYKCASDDFEGVNWLLSEAGVMGTINSIVSVGDTLQLVMDGGKIIMAGSVAALSTSLPGLLITAGLLTVGIYSDTMKTNALEKAVQALEYMVDGHGYAVYETWVMWHTIPNGYDVEIWDGD